MATKMVLLALVTIATLVTMAACVNLRESYPSSQESYEDLGSTSEEDSSSSESDWEGHSGSRSFYNMFWNFHHSRHRPWWEGPNVCQSERVEEKNATASGEEGGEQAVELTRHFSTRLQLCDESESVYKCTITEHNQEGQRKLVVLYECCKGFERQKGDDGCPRRVALRDLISLADQLGLDDFLKAVRAAGLEEELRSREVTVFAPINGGFGESPDLEPLGPAIVLQRDTPYTITEIDGAEIRALESIQSRLMNHVISGSRRSSSFNDEELVETGSDDDTRIRINFFYTPQKKVMTANCVPVESRDNRASNGVLHSVERFLPTVTDSLIDIVKSRPDLSTLKTVLAMARYVPKLEDEGQGTLLAPSNDAFARMNPRLRERLLAGDRKCLQKVLDNHLLPHTICSAVIQGKARTPNLLGNYLNISRSDDEKVFVHGAQVTQRDVMATNGVMHVIDKVIVPRDAMDLVDVLEEEGYTELLRLVDTAGLTKTLETAENVTVFAPTNDAIRNLPSSVQSQIRRDPELLRQVLAFHVSPGADQRHHLYDNQILPTLKEGSTIRIDSFSLHPFHYYSTATAQCVPLIPSHAHHRGTTKIEACNGGIRPIEGVMIPPRGNVVDVLARDKNFSLLVSLIKRAELADALQEEGPFTVFAPNNRAFERLGQATLESLDKDVETLKSILKRHVLADNLCCAGFFRGHSWYGQSRVRTLAGDRLRVSRDHNNTPTVEQSRVLTCDQLATNGNVLEIDSVLLNRQQRYGYQRRSHWGRNRFWDPFRYGAP